MLCFFFLIQLSRDNTVRMLTAVLFLSYSLTDFNYTLTYNWRRCNATNSLELVMRQSEDALKCCLHQVDKMVYSNSNRVSAIRTCMCCVLGVLAIETRVTDKFSIYLTKNWTWHQSKLVRVFNNTNGYNGYTVPGIAYSHFFSIK